MWFSFLCAEKRLWTLTISQTLNRVGTNLKPDDWIFNKFMLIGSQIYAMCTRAYSCFMVAHLFPHKRRVSFHYFETFLHEQTHLAYRFPLIYNCNYINRVSIHISRLLFFFLMAEVCHRICRWYVLYCYIINHSLLQINRPLIST